MKKRIIRLSLVLALMLCLSVSVFAESQLWHITDDAGILTESQNIELETYAENISQDYGVGSPSRLMRSAENASMALRLPSRSCTAPNSFRYPSSRRRRYSRKMLSCSIRPLPFTLERIQIFI